MPSCLEAQGSEQLKLGFVQEKEAECRNRKEVFEEQVRGTESGLP